MKIHTLLLALALAAPALCWQDGEASKLKVKGLREYAKQGSAAIPKIAPYLQDGDVDVRREATKALVTIGTQRSLDPLVTATKDNDAEVQIRATDGLVNFYLPGYVEQGLSAKMKRAGDIVTGKFSDDNSAVIEPDTPLRPEIVDGLSALTSGGSTMESRANAARALGILRAKGGVPALTDAFRSKDSQLLYESLIALQKIRDRSAGPKVAFLVRDLDEKVQIAAIETAGLLGANDAVPELKRVVEKTHNKKVRRAALTALAQIPDQSNRELFLGMANDKEEDARAAAAEGLGRLGHKEDLPVLETTFNSEKKSNARLCQAFAMAMLGNTDTGNFGPVGYLVNNLNQKAWRGVALPFLSELALKPDVRAAIIQVVGIAATKEEKTGLAQALAGCASADAIPPLEKLSQDEDLTVSREALRALRILRGSVK